MWLEPIVSKLAECGNTLLNQQAQASAPPVFEDVKLLDVVSKELKRELHSRLDGGQRAGI